MTLGIIFALLALLAWGFGDFFLQRSVRVFGSIRTLLYIDLVGLVVLFPFVQNELVSVAANPFHVLLLTGAGIAVLLAAVLDYEALRRGKLAIVEPVLALELPVVIGLSAFLWGERLSPAQWVLVTTTFVGIVLAVTEHHTRLHYHKRILERGVLLALAGSIVMGSVNFLIGVSSQVISPLMAIWFTSIPTVGFSVLYLAAKGKLAGVFHPIRERPKLFLAVVTLDNAAWLAYAFATAFIPIAVATTISESYIAVAVLLGLFVNREKLRYHQVVGVGAAIASVILLSAITG